MTSSTRAKPANLPATYQRRELRVQQPDGSILTLDEHLERRGFSCPAEPLLPALRPSSALNVRTSHTVVHDRPPIRRRIDATTVLVAAAILIPAAGAIIGTTGF